MILAWISTSLLNHIATLSIPEYLYFMSFISVVCISLLLVQILTLWPMFFSPDIEV